MRCLLIALVMIASPSYAVQKCQVNGKTVYTDQDCASIGGKGGRMTGGSLTVADSVKKHDNVLRDMQGTEICKMEVDVNNNPVRCKPDNQSGVVSVASVQDRRSRNFKLCSDMERARIDALRNGNRDYADALDARMKEIKCM